MDGSFIGKRLRGSYTVEAAFVMAVVLWAVVLSIQAALRVRDETAAGLALAEAVEQLRHGEEEKPEEAEETGLRRAGHPLSWSSCRYELEISGIPLTGRSVSGIGEGGKWRLELKREVFDPENFLRKLSLLEQEGQDGDHV